MKKLSKQQRERHAEILCTLAEKRDEFNEVVERLTKATDDAFAYVEEAGEHLQQAMSEAEEFTQEIAGEIDEYMGERSENWHETENGEATQGWHTEWDGVSLDGAFESPERPTEIELLADEQFEEFDNLPLERDDV